MQSAKDGMLGRLLSSVDDDGNPLTETQLIDNLLFLIFAGFDTTKSSFGSLWFNLLEHPDICDMLHKEVQGFSDPLDADELKSAPLLNAVLAETWRLAAPINSHSTIAKYDLEYKGYKYPKGTVFSVDTQAYHVTNEERFPESRTFRVERWLPPGHPLHNPKYYNGINYNVMSTKYRPFSVGAHMCLGAHFAKLEVRVVATRLIQKYHIETRNEQVRQFPTFQRYSDFKLTERDNNKKSI